MDTTLQYIFVITQFVAIAFLLCEIVYIAMLRASKFQVTMLLLVISTLVMLVGYSVELFATSIDGGLMGAAIAYIGKPFAILMSFAFIAEFCGKPLPKSVLVVLAMLGIVFPIIVFTNGYDSRFGHHLYYATVGFALENEFSPLVLTRGPLYYSYMVYLIGLFGATIVYIIIAARKTKLRENRVQLVLLSSMIFVTIAGYAIYLSGVTRGYDTTMTGAALGSIMLSIVFFRYKLFDSLTLAKDQALHHASNGLLVLNKENEPVYTNALIDNLLKSTFEIKDLLAYQDGKQIVPKEDGVYEINISPVINRGRDYGKTIEITDITAKYNYSAQLERDVEERTRELLEVQRAIIASFAGIVEARDNSTGVHIKRMSRFVELIAQSLMRNGDYSDILDEKYLACLVDVAPLHDIGKLAVPDNILLKPGKLTNEEFDIIKKHSSEGARIIEECLAGVERPAYVQMAEDVARSHHEKWNGMGYPNGLSGQDIPLSARIVAVADVYDAIRSERCYKPPMDKEAARQVILDGKGTHFDPVVVDAFMRVLPIIESI